MTDGLVMFGIRRRELKECARERRNGWRRRA
jgi:hypothetical protein